MAHEKIGHNVVHLMKGVKQFFKYAKPYAQNRIPLSKALVYPVEVLNNKTWMKDVSLLDFLRDVGVHARVNTMLSRDR